MRKQYWTRNLGPALAVLLMILPALLLSVAPVVAQPAGPEQPGPAVTGPGSDQSGTDTFGAAGPAGSTASGSAATELAEGAHAADNRDAWEIPVTAIRLYSNGVGWFEHSATVDGTARVKLSVPVEHMPDLLKTLTVQDLDGGIVELAEYEAKDPLERRLARYRIDLSGNPSLAQILNQMRGIPVVAQRTNGEILEGLLVGTETVEAPQGEGRVQRNVTIRTGSGLQQADLADLVSIRTQDGRTMADLDRALSEIAATGDERLRSVTVTFRGEGRRRVQLSYLRQMPVWKNSYRLVLGAGSGSNAGGGIAPNPAGADDTGTAGSQGSALGTGRASGPTGTTDDRSALLQGWAQVENTTDYDWTDVELSLFNGRPLSFRMDMYTPIYTDRPELPYVTQENVAPPQSQPSLTARSAPRPMMEAAPMESPAEPSGIFGGGRDYAADSVQASATAESRDTLVEYRIDDPTTIRRNRSAMVPIVVTDVDVETVSVYNRSVVPDRPLRSVRFANPQQLPLVPGPVTIIDGAQYAGEGRLGLVPAGEETFVPYAVDSEVVVDTESSTEPEVVTSISIVDGVLVESRLMRMETLYKVNNRASQDRILVVEHPIRSGWDLVYPRTASEETPDYYRFRRTVNTDSSTQIRIREERPRTTRIALANTDDNRIAAYLEERDLSARMRRALQTIQELRTRVAEIRRQRQNLESEENRIYRDQERIRSNMTELDRDSTLYRRYVTDLAEQEDRLEVLRRDLEEVRQEEATAEATLREYIRGLTVE